MATLYWLRNDLRLHDNECLQQAIQQKKPLLLIYCFDIRQFEKLNLGFRKTGYLRFNFLCETLEALRVDLQAIGGSLLIKVGLPELVLKDLVEEHSIEHLYYQEEVAKEEKAVEIALSKALAGSSCQLHPIWGKTLYHIKDAPFTTEETPKTSKAFRIQLTKQTDVRPLIPTPMQLPPMVALKEWGQLPSPKEMGYEEQEITPKEQQFVKGGEQEALARLNYYTFESELATTYKWTRNRSLGMDYSSKFSPWMALGSLSPRKIYWQIKKYEEEVKRNISTWWLVFEVVWRDYFKYTALREGNKIFFVGGLKDKEVDWEYDEELFERWALGKTGIPFVDAHMRQLHQTGFMSNRGRVNCASFLTIDYQIDWRWGAAWFETQLLDYDVCSNWLNWSTQGLEIWYTNPVHQSMKYDKEAAYIKKWLPELQAIEGPLAIAPWLLQEEEKAPAIDYPAPVAIYKKWTRSINNIKKAQVAFEHKETKKSTEKKVSKKKK